ncbi:MAG: hypothetical protein JW818_03245 [Pirellulales bacterium]|nr:hypothetical protein [Pirellulales bacterium]
MEQAFQKAKAHAERLAKAAGRPLGELVGLAGGNGGATDEIETMISSPYSYRQHQYLNQFVDADLTSTGEPDPLVHVSQTLGPVTFQFGITASYRVGK